jgi:hypothetical protein
MKTYYANEGQPDQNGNLCMIIDMEDGRPVPQRVYAKTHQELTAKVAGMYGNAAARLTEVKRDLEQAGLPTRRQNDSAPAPTSPTAPRQVALSPADKMQRTHDLNSPEKSAAAVAALVENELGVPLEDVRAIVQQSKQRQMAQERADMMRDWGDSNPEFPQHPINRTMMVNRATIKAGGLQNVTHAILDDTFMELQEQGLLVPAEVQSTAPVEDHTPQPVGTARTRSATSVRRQDLTARPGTQTTRWTDQQIQAAIAGPDAEYKRLYNSDQTFQTAVNAYVAKNRRRAG